MTGENGRPSRSIVDQLRDETRLDSLTRVVNRLLRRDLVHGFWPSCQQRDRGIELEEHWRTLDTTFEALWQGERDGWRPSLIVSPMVVETGRRLLFSNLNLTDLTGIRPQPGKPIYSYPAAEFFLAFPEVYATFRLRTAIRMNASFPYIAPAVCLPTAPPRRLVDAGYYDNYGVDLACSWAYKYGPWLNQHTSGVALVQIRAYPSEDRRKKYFDPEREATTPGSVATALQFLTTPPEAFGSAWAWSMSYRNDEGVRGLDDMFHYHLERSKHFFETFVFENPLGFGMNWFLAEDDLQEMAYCIGSTSDASFGRDDPRGADRREKLRTLRETNMNAKKTFQAWWTGPVDAAPYA